MKFITDTTEILSKLLIAIKTISSKNTTPILDNFKIEIGDQGMLATASDLETTISTVIQILDADVEGSFCVPAKLFIDTLKELPDMPLTFESADNVLTIKSDKGKFCIPIQSSKEYPTLKDLNDECSHCEIESKILLGGIKGTAFAVANDELRPVMNGIFIELSDKITFVASDAHKLVEIIEHCTESSYGSFILPSKAASILNNILEKYDGTVYLSFDQSNAKVELPNFSLNFRLIEGEYPKYKNILPTGNDKVATANRSQLIKVLKRVSVFSNQASNLVKLNFTQDSLKISAQDIDYSISAYESLSIDYSSEDIEIGFKSSYLIEILSSLKSEQVQIKLSTTNTAGLIVPVSDEVGVTALLMPMMVS